MEDRQQSYRRPPKRPSLRQSSSVSSSASTSASPPAQPSALNRSKGRAIHDPRLEEDPFGEEYTVEVSTNDSEDEVEENNLIEDDQGASSSRGKKAWAARKARRVERLREAEKYIHIPPMPPPSKPTSDLLQAIHHHASHFYTSTSLLMPPKKRQRAMPWASKKRVEVLKDSLLSKGHAQDIESLVNEHGEFVSVAKEEKVDRGRIQGPRGKYKVRDMYRAIEGEGLMAIGIILQEYIIRTLREIGYQPGEGSQAETESKGGNQARGGNEEETNEEEENSSPER
ncbi:hypothetical protein C345_00179 [Cryptococcus neoformans A2-102-5]|nr:hypothetical protein C345_00179 [Cryptococcus neoformans var. grubii A2-102-5]